MHYLNHWKLVRAPFDLDTSSSLATASVKRDTSTFFAKGSIEEALNRFRFFLESQRRLAILSGECGTGKTRTMIEFAKSASRPSISNVRVVYLSTNNWSDQSFFRWILEYLGEGPFPSLLSRSRSNDSSELERQLALDVLRGLSSLRGSLMFLIDDLDQSKASFQNTLAEVLQSYRNIAAIVSTSQSVASEALPTKLTLRSQLRIELPVWNLGQTAEYIAEMLERVNAAPTLFTAKSITRIHDISGGIIRNINQLADLALVAGAAENAVRIQPELIDKVALELESGANSQSLKWLLSSDSAAVPFLGTSLSQTPPIGNVSLAGYSNSFFAATPSPVSG
jgi:type II secretory pathway predicted ATPase ExeA